MKIFNTTYTIPTVDTSKSGFTFVETMVAITILLVSIVAPMSLAQEGIMAARLSQDQIVAFYLGQEGIEIVKNMRDANRLSNAVGQLTGDLENNCKVDDPDSGELGCTVDSTVAPGDVFSTERCVSVCDPIRKSTGVTPRLYTYQAGGTEATKYVREVKVWYPGVDPSEAVVEVTVTWPFGKNNLEKTYVVKNYLYNW